MVMHELRPLVDLKWTPEEKLHITTKFIGEWPEQRLADLQGALAGIASPAIPIRIHGLGWMPNALYAGVDAREELKMLAERTEAALEVLGVAREKRDYRPHVTLARGKRRATPPAREFDLRFEATSFYLYLSASGKYTRLNEFPLRSA